MPVSSIGPRGSIEALGLSLGAALWEIQLPVFMVLQHFTVDLGFCMFSCDLWFLNGKPEAY